MQIFDAYGSTLPMADAEEILVGFEVYEETFEEGKPPKIRQVFDALELTCPFDVNGDFFSWIIQKPDLGGGSGGWPHVFQVLNTITKDSFIYEIVLPQNRPEE